MTDHYLAHLNVVRPVGPMGPDVPEAQYFFRQLQALLPQAKAFEGMRWHNHGARMPDGSYLDLPELVSLSTQSGEDNPHVMTMAGWDSAQALHGFAYRVRDHMEGMKTLRDWVDRSEGSTMAMWWVPNGERVTLEGAWEKLHHLREHGPTPDAFTLQERFEAPDV